MSTKIAFISNGCQGGFGVPREIIAANPDLEEARSPNSADLLMVNFCAISAAAINDYAELKRQVAQYKERNPQLKVLAGGCIKGLRGQAEFDFSFADATFYHQEEAAALANFLGESGQAPLAPNIMAGAVAINIAQGCNRRCAFCKTHYLEHMALRSRPPEQIVALARQALAQGYQIIVLTAENSTEYGIDCGSSLTALLQQLLELEGLRYLDIYGLCLDEVGPDLLELLQNPRIRALQLEVQSLNDGIRRNMKLKKSSSETLEILDALQEKVIISNLMTGFPGHSIKEFNRELKLIQAHHLYYLSFDPYDDTVGTPSHKIYVVPSAAEAEYYQLALLETLAKERQRVLEQVMRQPSIEGAVSYSSYTELCLQASAYSMQIKIDHPERKYREGKLLRVKITGLYEIMPPRLRQSLLARAAIDKRFYVERLLKAMRYCDLRTHDHALVVTGQVVDA